MAVAGCDFERVALHGLLSTIRSSMALLVCVHSAHCCDLVLRKKFRAAMVAEFTPRLCRRDHFFCDNIQLVRLAWDFVREFLVARLVTAARILSWSQFCFLELVHWINRACIFPELLAKFVSRVPERDRVGCA